MVDLRIFINLAVMLIKSPFLPASQCASRPWKSKLFHNPTDTTLADIYTEIMPQNHANLRFHVRFSITHFGLLRPEKQAFQTHPSTNSHNFLFLFAGNPMAVK